MKTILQTQKCFGCGACAAACPKSFEMNKDGKAHLKNSKLNPETNEEELETEETNCIQEAVNVCPAQCIKIVN